MSLIHLKSNFYNLLAVISVIATGVIFGFSAPVSGQYLEANITSGVSQEVQAPSMFFRISMGNALEAGRVGGKNFSDGQAMQVFYQTRHNQPYWTGNSGPSEQAERFLAVLEDSWTHGLNPYSYHIEDIRALLKRPGLTGKARLELFLTDAFVRYAQDLTGMRIEGKAMKLDPDHWRQSMGGHDILSLLSGRERLDKALKVIEPRGKTYKSLQKELIRLSGEEGGDYERYLPIEFGGMMKPGWGHRGVPSLRGRLGLPQPERSRTKYDDHLAAAVMKFQRENDLEPDGIIGAKTLQLLNRTKQDKMLQLIANMERLRWVENEKPDRFIIVNIPSATLWALDHGRVKLEMPVIVGSPWRRTRVFKTDVTGVRFNPTWTVPATIKRYDILPKVQEDANYLSDKGIELIHGYGRNAETLDPSSIDWNNISLRDLHDIRMVMIPGEHNPLGRVRILMPNRYNMYLHDTNHPEYFDKPERTLSSGCIRMKYPEKVAQFVMAGRKGWSSRDMQETLETGEKTDIEIKNHIPVYVLYYTAWIGEKGQVVYGTDVYNYDRKLIELLEAIDGFYIPRHNDPDLAEIASAR